MKKIFKKNCFAYCEKKGEPYCNALCDCNCNNCSFYKERQQIKKNPFYAFSYDNEMEHLKDVKKRNIKEECVIWK